MKESISRSVVKVIRKKEGLVRDTVKKKKCKLVSVIKDVKMLVRHESEKQEKKACQGHCEGG